MTDLFVQLYPWIKSLHIMSVIAWMAGLFYLPRLFVHHTERASENQEMSQTFTMMERKLLKLIMNPSMISTWVFGLLLVMTPGIVPWSDIWPWIKLISILAMTWFHMWLAARYKDFEADANTRTGRTFRIMNEVPTLLMIAIVVSVIARPF